MARLELKEIAFQIFCNCGKEFRVESFELEFPYRDRGYIIRMVGSLEEVKVEIKPFSTVRGLTPNSAANVNLSMQELPAV